MLKKKMAKSLIGFINNGKSFCFSGLTADARVQRVSIFPGCTASHSNIGVSW